ncbi:unnamed protein product [Mytilus edulis]|uniref:Uncharacterized protein n=1 Tax=Mytilus edulis TaxID=6550 RepID=A0A8S3RHD8_MYTED|nr:unnamed protein product [Mytilus edulis]
MSANKTESFRFYDYLCNKIGSEQVVKGRRLIFGALDAYGRQKQYTYFVSSGSRSEGLDLKGSDLDMMFVDTSMTVYKFEREAVQGQRVVLLMDTAYTHPCFTYLQLNTNNNILEKGSEQLIELHGMQFLLSSELCKQFLFRAVKKGLPMINKIHGPCLADRNDKFLCYYHLHDSVTCVHAWYQLFPATMKILSTGLPLNFLQIQSLIFVGIAAQMTDQADMAKKSFRIVAKYDENKVSSVAIRLRELSGPSV